MIHIALYQPDIPQNLGTSLRTAACFGCTIHIIEPCGFPLDDRKLRRAGMDYIDFVTYIRHNSWQDFYEWTQANHKRLVLLTTKTPTSYTDFKFELNDILLAGRESAGVPDIVHHACTEKVTIPMQTGMRSLNVAVSVSIVVSEAIRQLR